MCITATYRTGVLAGTEIHNLIYVFSADFNVCLFVLAVDVLNMRIIQSFFETLTE